MHYFNSISHEIKPIMSGHDTFPLRYGWIKKVYDRLNENDDSNVFLEDYAITHFGVGKNMLNAMRHWCYYLGFIYRTHNKTRLQVYHNTDNKHTNTEIGLHYQEDFYHAKQFFDNKKGFDIYLESPSTLWLMHWTLATNPNLITYYWFFNINTKSVMTHEDFFCQIKDFLAKYPTITLPSESTIKKDIQCFILNYGSKYKKDNENIEKKIESPLSEIGIISRISQNKFKVLRGQKKSLSINIFVYCLVGFWKKFNSHSGTLSLEMITYDECSVGRVFALNENAIIDYAESINNSEYPLTWIQSSGIRLFQLINGKSLDDLYQLSIRKIKEEDYLK